MRKKILFLLVASILVLTSILVTAALAEPLGGGSQVPRIDANNQNGEWKAVQQMQLPEDPRNKYKDMKTADLIKLIQTGSRVEVLLAMQELGTRGEGAANAILTALKDPKCENAAYLAMALVTIAKNNPEVDVLARLAIIANDPNKKYSEAVQMAAAEALLGISGKKGYEMLSKDMKFKVAENILRKAYDIHSTWYWHNKPGHRYDPWPNR